MDINSITRTPIVGGERWQSDLGRTEGEVTNDFQLIIISTDRAAVMKSLSCLITATSQMGNREKLELFSSLTFTVKIVMFMVTFP